MPFERHPVFLRKQKNIHHFLIITLKVYCYNKLFLFIIIYNKTHKRELKQGYNNTNYCYNIKENHSAL